MFCLNGWCLGDQDNWLQRRASAEWTRRFQGVADSFENPNVRFSAPFLFASGIRQRTPGWVSWITAMQKATSQVSIEMMSHLAKFVDALESHGCSPRVIGDDRGRARCPGSYHRRGDKKASLGFTGLPDKVIFNCFVCRSPGKPGILKALDLTYADLFAASSIPRQVFNARRQRVEAYVYEDIDGHLLSEKLRYEPKSFKWRSPRAAGGFDWRKAAGVSLYRLPHLIDMRLVIVVEGERAVNRLVSLGFAATCPPAGCNVWQESYTDALWRAGVMVVVTIHDNDRPGREHAMRVVQACHGYRPALVVPDTTEEPWGEWPNATLEDPEVQPMRAKLLTLDDLPHTGDICDWLDPGHSVEELTELIRTAPDLDEAKRAKQEHRRRVDRDRQRRHRAKIKATQPRRRSA